MEHFFGSILYLLAFSNVFMSALVKFLLLIKKIVNKFIVNPIKGLIKLISKPIKFVCVNISKMKIGLMSKLEELKKIKKQKVKSAPKKAGKFIKM